MKVMRNLGRGAFAALLCLSLAAWSVVPSASHAPRVIKTLQDHLEMIDEHGHSHGLEEDLFWAMHGHSHDTADHDHSQAVLALAGVSEIDAFHLDLWRLHPSPRGPSRIFRIERPPRA